MRKATFIVLLGAGIILSLAGCQKGPERSQTANLVKFKATSAAPLTRAAYATGSDAVVGGVQRIDWKAGDQVLVWSDEALNQLSPAKKQYTYAVGTITKNGAKSIATAYDDASQGLTWTEGVSTFKFAAYSKQGISEAAWDADGNPTALTATVPDEQTVTFTDGYGLSGMDMFLIANPLKVAANTEVDLQFEPYFTAFEINVASTDEIKIKGVTLRSEARTNGANTFGPSTMNGSFTASMSLADANPAWVVTVPETTETNAHQVATTFATPIALTKASEEAAKTNEARFVLFATPNDITSLTMDFLIENAAGNEEHRRASLSYKEGDSTHAAGDPVTFAGRKKHKITGLTLAPINKDIELILQVKPWVDETGTINYGPDAIINATALEYVSGAAITEGGSRRRNNNFASNYAPVEGVDQAPIWGYFYVFAPMEIENNANKTKWQITVSGATNLMDVNVLQTEGLDKTTNGDGTIILTGPTGGRVDFQISRLATVTAANTIQLNFAVVMSDGRVISMNSEITRRNALTISGKVGQ